MIRNHLMINIALIAIAGFLGYELYVTAARPVIIPSKVAAVKAASDTANQADTQSQPVVKDPGVYQAIVQKDLFKPTRAEPKVDPAKMRPLTPPPRLVGTMIIEGKAEAFLEDSVNKSVKPYRVNDKIGDFTVVDIKDNRVSVKRTDEKTVIEITLAGPSAPAAAATPTPATAPPVAPGVAAPAKTAPPAAAPAQNRAPQSRRGNPEDLKALRSLMKPK